MIRFTRTAVVAGGHNSEALEFAGKVTALVNGRYPEARLQWGVQIGGTTGVVHWTMDLPDLAALEKMFGELVMDGEYLELVDGAGGCFVPGSTSDQIVSLVG